MSLFRRRGLQFLTKQNNGEDESIETLLGGDKEKKVGGINILDYCAGDQMIRLSICEGDALSM